MIRWLLLATSLLLLGLWLSVSKSNDLPELGERYRHAISAHEAREVGTNLYLDLMRKDPRYLDDVVVEDYLQNLVDRLAEHLPQTASAKASFRVIVLRDGNVNAFAALGGVIGVNTGLLALTQDEAELAAVLAHELAHHDQFHFVRMQDQAQDSGLLTLALMAAAVLLAGGEGQSTEAAITGGYALHIDRNLSYSRQFEREADRIGGALLTRAGYDRHAMARMLRRLNENLGHHEHQSDRYLRTHPLSAERIADSVGRNPQFADSVSTPSAEFLRLKAWLALPLTEAQQQAYPALTRFAEAKRSLTVGDADHAAALIKRDNAAHPLDYLIRARIAEARHQPILATLAQGVQRFGDNKALILAYGQALLQAKQWPNAQNLLRAYVTKYGADARVYQLLARGYQNTGQNALYHRYLAEYYAELGDNAAAIVQFDLSHQAPDADRYDQAIAESKLRVLRELVEQ